MAEVQFQSAIKFPTVSCQDIQICLSTEGQAKFTGNPTTVTGQVGDSVRHLGPHTKCCGHSVRGQEQIQYTFNIDDSLLATDPGTGQPFELGCNDIESINPYACV